ncbi:MAG: DUF4301 family protein [Bacteroidales bacterium]|nr:DUF4301 family protein [Bacteroidales bacterium]
MFSSKDIHQLNAKGISLEAIEQQINYFQTGFPFLQADRAATAGDGIRQLSADTVDALEQAFSETAGSRKMLKFVPASGAATRMFKDLYEFVSGAAETATIKEIFDRLSCFAFYNALKPFVSDTASRKAVAEAILMPGGLNYGNLPKGMLLFHSYADGARTALEEHLAEGAAYACNADKTVHLHFTVSAEHQAGFEALVNEKLRKYADLYGVTCHIGFSQQKPFTDTLAVDCDNRPMRNSDGSLLFRPGGHGALLENLNEQEADIIYIKTIDNVVPDCLKPVTIQYKKALAVLLIRMQDAIYRYIRRLRAGDASVINEIKLFLQKEMSFQLPTGFDSRSTGQQSAYLLKTLNRPIRVCGMVKNEGEPGGSPFWVKNSDGSVSLQIAESSQIDRNNPQQKAIAAGASHFNPVDLVCAVKDVDGKAFDLLQYRDSDTGFISRKSKDGVELKAQELPGLWNGAMAFWNTVFVEVPIETFNPVKTMNDLLRPQHQNQ